MKKFFSLVLALVMALSLTTVAWGAATSDEIVTVTGTVAKFVLDTTEADNTTTTETFGSFRDLPVYKRVLNSLTIEGQGATVAGFEINDGTNSRTQVNYFDIGTLTFTGMTFTDRVELDMRLSQAVNGHYSKAFVTIDTLVFDTVTFDGASLHYLAYYNDIKNIIVKNCVFKNTTSEAITVRDDTGLVNVEVNDCEFYDVTDNAVQIAGSTPYTGNIVITDNTIERTTDRAIRIPKVGAGANLTVVGNTVTDGVDGDGEVMKTTSIDSSVTTKFWNNDWDGGAVVSDDANAAMLQDIGSGVTTDANGKFTGGTFYTDVSDNMAPGYSFVNGEVKKTTSFGSTTTYDVKDLTVTKPDGSKKDTTGITGIVKVASVTNTSTVNGVTKTNFVPAWYQLTDGVNVGTFVECDKSVATYMFTIKGVGSVYVREMNVPAAFDATPVTLYTAPKTATCDKVGANEDVYVVVDGKYYPTKNVAVESYGLLNGKMVVFDKTQAGTPTPHDWNNVTAASYNSATGKLTAVKCPVCKGTVAVYEKPGSFDGKEYKLVGGNGIASAYYYVVGAAATSFGTTTGTTTGTVTSAETFDAGIALYVGMSVMAAAGSAVVLKKKD